jgi:hypothetical protein
MTESEGLASLSIEFLVAHLPENVVARKFRLALCACLRSPGVWPLLVSKSSRRALEVCEQFADGEVGPKDRRAALTRAHGAWGRIGPLTPLQYAAAELASTTCWANRTLLRGGPVVLRRLASQPEGHRQLGQNLASAVPLLLDIFGNRFRKVIFKPVSPTPTVLSLAQAAYDERLLPSGELDRDRLGIVGDALEDAGCEDAYFLGHLRGGGPHVRGCWALDSLLGKE